MMGTANANKTKGSKVAPAVASRAANYVIQGFLYQFNKTIIEVLKSSDDAEIVVEGVIEDIDVHEPMQTEAIQCKYHEALSSFSLSIVYKPILQMMSHFHKNPKSGVRYRLFAHFPEKVEEPPLVITNEQIHEIMKSSNKELASLIDELKGNVAVDNFLPLFVLEFGPTYDELVRAVAYQLQQCGFAEDDIPVMVYPNAFHIIAIRSIQRESANRRITRKVLLSQLNGIKKTTISKWTLTLKTAKKILDARRKQLQKNLKLNARRRTFVIAEVGIRDFSEQIVIFIYEYIEKYHTKIAHTETPLFCLSCSQEAFEETRQRLHKKGIKFNDGYIGYEFHKENFFRKPMLKATQTKIIDREFLILLIRHETNFHVLNTEKPDDIFLIDSKLYPELDLQDVNEERLAVKSLQQAKYLLGMSDAHD